ncbi:MAG: AMP-binding protein [Acutalibacteraceae bacterium]|nr:AMP-binding protein [Acutalibacteraceae bacterium]
MYEPIQRKLEYSFRNFPDDIAINFDDINITYSTLEEYSKKWAYILAEHLGNTQFPRCALLFKNRIDYIFAMVSVLFLRGVFVPIDLSLPKEKILQILNKNDIDILLYDFDDSNNEIFPLLEIDSLHFNYDKYSDETVSMELSCYLEMDNYCVDDPIYLYFTSGSTGVSKGVLGKNVSLVHFINWEVTCFNIDSNVSVAQLTIPSFDPFLRDIFVPLFVGGKICLFSERYERLSFNFIVDYLIEKQITLLHCVPNIFHVLLFCIQNKKINILPLKYIFLAGDKIDISDIQLWYKLIQGDTVLINLYGPTETTLAKLYHIVAKNDIESGDIPIGKSLPDVKVYLLNDLGEKTEQGEICIETEFSTFGYIDKSLNKGKFFDSSNPKAKIYHTGDYGVKRYDGEIIFIGRKDRQVKLSGISANLSAIESCIRNNSDIQQCILTVDKTTGRLRCFYLSEYDIDFQKLNLILLKYFQRVFIPIKYIKVSYMKTNNNGKLDFNQFNDYEE